MKHVMVWFAYVLLGFSVPASADWQFSTIDDAGSVGGYVNLVFDSQGNEHVAYSDYGNEDVKYAYWDGSSWQIEVVDAAGDVGNCISMALDADDYPHIAYYDDLSLFTGNLKYARWDGSTWHTEIIDNGGRHTSLALDASGYPHITHNDLLNTSLKYARWDGSTWQLETVENTGDVGVSTALALDDNDLPHVAYRDLTNGHLDYAWFESPGGTGPGQCTVGFHLLQNVPNPFSSQTTINFELPASSQVNLMIFDVTGRVVRRLLSRESCSPATHQVIWDGCDDSGRPVSAGVYFYQLFTPGNCGTRWMVLLK